MQDAFEMLKLPRRPWLDEAGVRSAFQQAAAQMHPDTTSGSAADFTELTNAYQTLREPAKRLRHLLALESSDLPLPAGAPAELMPLFPLIAGVRQKLDRMESETDILPIRKEAHQVSEQLKHAMDTALLELREADAAWPSASATRMVAALQSRLTFLEKWHSQLREALLRLDIGTV
jgi:curved DNA-binding protein CbpA